MEALKIVAFCVVAAVVYGISHDQVTARVCVEYFTVAHPIIIPTESPTALAFLWGVIATWWVGLGLGLPLALFARVGGWPKLGVRDLVRPVALLLLVMALVALTAGLIGYRLGLGGFRPDFLDLPIRPERMPLLLADAFAHDAAYATGFLGGLVVWAWALATRCRRRGSPPIPR